MFVFVILWPIIGPSLHAYAYEGGATSDPSGRVGIPPTLPPRGGIDRFHESILFRKSESTTV